MNRCHLNRSNGDCFHGVLCAAGFNINWMLRMYMKKSICFFAAVTGPQFG
jgi:transposase, IS5 family